MQILVSNDIMTGHHDEILLSTNQLHLLDPRLRGVDKLLRMTNQASPTTD